MLIQLITGRFMTHAVGAVAELGIADQMKDGPLGADEIAKRVKAHGPSIYRLLRALSVAGVFVEPAGKRFSLTPVGELLRTDVPGSLAGMATFLSSPFHGQAWFELKHSLRTGETAFDKAFGRPMFKWFVDHDAEAQVFHQAMVSFSSGLGQAVVAAYDFSRYKTIADIGGGHGTLLAIILGKHQGSTGVVFDLPEVVKGAPALLEKHGVAARAKPVGGDFLKSVPPADAYVIKHIIHDWSDEASVTILRNCAASMNPGGRVLLVEMVVPPPGAPSFAKILDLEMLVMTPGGRERTEAEYSGLFAEAGLKLERIVPTQSPVSVIEASKA
jgi:hypothetical protein